MVVDRRDYTVFTWLDEVSARPLMYVGMDRDPLGQLETMVHGHYAALSTHGLVESMPAMSHHFARWLGSTRRWSTCCGWASAISSHARGRDVLEGFFRLVDQYRLLEPAVVRVGIPRDRPARLKSAPVTPIEIVRYLPTRMHFLRTWSRRASDRRILMTTSGSHDTTISFAKATARKENLRLPLEWREG
jgi:hypothetical protein